MPELSSLPVDTVPFPHVLYTNCELRVIKSLSSSDRKRPQEVFSPTSWSKKEQLWAHTILLRALASWVLKISQDGDHTSTFCKRFHRFLTTKKVFFTYILNLPWFYLCLFFSSPFSHVPLKSLASSSQQPPCRYSQAAVCPPQSHPCSRLNKPTSLSLSSLAKCSSSQQHDGPLLNLLQFIQCLSCTGGSQNWRQYLNVV